MNEWKPNIDGITRTITECAEELRNRAELFDQMEKCFRGRRVKLLELPAKASWKTFLTNADWMWNSFQCDVLKLDGEIHFVKVGSDKDPFIYTDFNEELMDAYFGDGYEWL